MKFLAHVFNLYFENIEKPVLFPDSPIVCYPVLIVSYMKSTRY